MPSYTEQLKSPKWQKKRLEILERDSFTCQLCSDTETELHIHHKSYEKGKKAWEYEDGNFQTLCKHCHKVVESFKDYKLTPVISSKYFVEDFNRFVISTIFNSKEYGLVLAINYYQEKTGEFLLVTMIEKTPFKDINKLFNHAEKLIK